MLPLPESDSRYRPYVVLRKDSRRRSTREGDRANRNPTPFSVLRSALDRTMIHWSLAYLAAAWLVLQLMDVLSEIWPIPVIAQRFVCLTLALGLCPALVIAWFHGEQGRQRVSGLEAVLVGGLLFASGVVLWAVFG